MELRRRDPVKPHFHFPSIMHHAVRWNRAVPCTAKRGGGRHKRAGEGRIYLSIYLLTRPHFILDDGRLDV